MAVRAPELPYLEVFHAVCEAGGFTAAAERLGRTQPAVSYQIGALEDAFGAKLIERGGRRVLLTPAGRRLQSFCERFFAELARTRAQVVSGQRLEPLQLGAASGFGRYVLVPALHALRETEAARDIEVRLDFEAADLILDRLERGEYEAAFVYKRRISSLLRYEAVYDEELVLIAAPSFARALDASILKRVERLTALPFVTYEESDYVFGRWFETAFGEPPALLASASRFTELEEVVDFVRRGTGLSIVPRDSVEAACARGEVEILYAGRGKPCLNQVFLVVRAGSEVRPEIRRLVELMVGPSRR